MEMLILLLIIAVLFLFVRMAVLGSRIRILEKRLGVATEPHTPVPTAPAAAGFPPPPVSPAGVAASGEPAVAAPVAPPAVHVPAPPRVHPPKPRRTSQEWEWLIGGKLLNRIAAVALVLGVSFFLKYAIDRNWITEWLQIGIGVSAGAALLAGAARMHRRDFQIFAQGLVGAGIAILYLSVYASFNFYSLVSQPVAFLMMGTVTVVTFSQAFRYDSLAVSLLGWAGGFATPFLLSTGSAHAAGLFTYCALLDAGLLGIIALRRAWFILLPLAFAATWFIFYLWLDGTGGTGEEVTGAVAAGVFWLLFHALDVHRTLRGLTNARAFERIIAIAGGILFYSAVYALIDGPYHAWMGGITLAAAALPGGSAVLVARNGSPSRAAYMHYAIGALLLLVFATELQFDGFAAIIGYTVEIVLLVLVSRAAAGSTLRAAAAALVVWAALALLFTEGALSLHARDGYIPVANLRALAFLLLTVSSALVVVHLRDLRGPWAPLARGAIHSILVFLPAVLLAAEIIDVLQQRSGTADQPLRQHLQYLSGVLVGAAWTAYGAAVIHLARRHGAAVIISVAGLIAILGAFLTAVWNVAGFLPEAWYTPVLNLHLAGSVVTGLALAWTAWTLSRQEGWLRKAAPVFTVSWIVIGFAALTAEISDTYGQLIRAAGPDTALPFAQVMALAAAWTLYGTAVFAHGSRTADISPVVCGLVLVATGWLTAIIRGIAFEPVTAFNPVLNMRAGMMVLTGAGLVITRIVARGTNEKLPWMRPIPPVLRILASLLLLVLLTGEIRDYFEKAIALQDPAIAATSLENIKQLMLSAAWLGFSISLMVYGILGRERHLRMVAIVLFGIAILKIFIYDLSFLETLYRIFSFIGLGVILLAVSYLYQRYRDVILGSGGNQEGV